MNEEERCTRCGRVRLLKYVTRRKNYSGKLVWRCRARSVCSTIARRNKNKKKA